MQNAITTGDLYESAYYYLNKSEIETIECQQVNGKLSCQITFAGMALSELQFNYFKGTAEVNLFKFRRAYSQIASYMYEAKKKYRQQLREQELQTQASSPEGGVA